MKLLALDTASAQCSVALLQDGQVLVRSQSTARDHATLILPMVDELLAEAGLALSQMDGIAFGRGPGSFTGVRIAAAVTQGLAAGADLPVLPISDLRALAAQARRLTHARAVGGWILACMDARMGEVYWGVFDDSVALPGVKRFGEAVAPPGALPDDLRGHVAGAAGRGLAAYPSLPDWLGVGATACLPEAEPHALDVAQLAGHDLAAGQPWLDAQAAQPVYLRDQVAKMQQ
ncbi:MAG TPA: tRNA (adenosine(37)-N6)-threonylcarbamoyltransferase complex dimerization subunit type 1 TsaB [Steroidobacteraceae bacterium]|nr:tRNA (adenosine(37)-N6)-threonylcarbamoyltransferase complex dimerization subunit type 1 TsaB [Steroidobacteraceae bacterium]